MFVVLSTAYGVSQRMLAYERISDAMVRAAVAPETQSDKSQIFRVSTGSDTRAAVSAVGVGKGVYVDAVMQPQPETATAERGADQAKAQLLAALLQESGETPK